ncbi:MAG TPA: hypothetical protein VMF63_13300 [Opitutaceae bacterium]|nr:hypothetical protein [Opitutaceae bacterium]
MSVRLQELLRQKALLAEQAAWLEREIAAEQAKAAGGPAEPLPAPLPFSATMPAPAAPAPAVPAGAAAADTEADAILAQYREADGFRPQRVKWGCILYTVAGAVLVLLGFVVMYVLARHR